LHKPLTIVAAFILLFFWFLTAFQKSTKAVNKFNLVVIPFALPFAEFFQEDIQRVIKRIKHMRGKKMKKAGFSCFSWIVCFHVTNSSF
jgi:hypothetical protein